MRAQDIFDQILEEARESRKLAEDKDGKLIDSEMVNYALGLYRAAEIVAGIPKKGTGNE